MTSGEMKETGATRRKEGSRHPGERRDPAPLQAAGKSLDSGFRRNDEQRNEGNRRDEEEGMKEVVIPANAGMTSGKMKQTGGTRRKQ
jgi:hypothetical protein